MDYKDIEQLLKRYFQCETSLEEEARLRDFFTGGQVPEHLMRYRDLFVYQQMEAEECLGDDFDARILAEIEGPVVVKARRVTLTARFMPLMKAAAAVALVLSTGSVMQHSIFSDMHEIAATDTIGKQISAPSVALTAPAAVQEAHEKQLIDSLQQVEQQRKAEIKE